MEIIVCIVSHHGLTVEHLWFIDYGSHVRANPENSYLTHLL